MEAKVFKTGDVVQLNSGGPKMTVKKYTARPGGGSDVECQWFNNGTVLVGMFPGESLNAVNIDSNP